jgi:hypothetical protein
MRQAALMSLATLLAWLTPAWAVEDVNGQGSPPFQRNNMHSCPEGFVVTGVNIDHNWLLCDGAFGVFGHANPGHAAGTANEVTDFGMTPANQHPYTSGKTMHWCGPDRMVTGVDVAHNGFGCANYLRAGGPVVPLGRLVLDGAPGTQPTQRSGMHACPVGFVLVGAFFDENAFLCAERQYCTMDGQLKCPVGQCKRDGPPPSGEDQIARLTGTCQ